MEEINYDLFLTLRDKLNHSESMFEFLKSKRYTPSKSMECIFHKHGIIGKGNKESTPSLSIDDKKGKFHCFSCGRSGGYTEFIYWYAIDVDGKRIEKKEFINNELERNQEWQVKYGIKSLKAVLEFSVDNLKYLFESSDMLMKSRRRGIKEEYNEKDSKAINYIRIKMFRKLNDENDILKFLSDIQYEESLKI